MSIHTETPATGIYETPTTVTRPRRILVVANRTAATPTLLNEVRARVQAQPCEVALLIPQTRSRNHVDCTFDVALPPLARATGSPVEALVGHPDAFEAVRAVLQDRHFDEIIVSTLARRYSRWLRRNLPGRVERLGVPVTVVTAPEPDRDPWREFSTTARVRAGERPDEYC